MLTGVPGFDYQNDHHTLHCLWAAAENYISLCYSAAPIHVVEDGRDAFGRVIRVETMALGDIRNKVRQCLILLTESMLAAGLSEYS